MSDPLIGRRSLLSGLALGSGMLLSGCDRLNASPGFRGLMEGAEQLHYRSQRWLSGGNAMAPMLPLFQALASGDDLAYLHAGPGRALRVEIDWVAVTDDPVTGAPVMISPSKRWSSTSSMVW